MSVRAYVCFRGSSGGGGMGYESKFVQIWVGKLHVHRRRDLRIGNPIGRQAEHLDQEAERVERQENQAGMGRVRKELLAAERAAMSAEDQRR